jgi:4,5-dihydroxyphthalate decarboxylase
VSKTKLVLGVADHDLNRPLIDGEVQSPDLDLDIVWQPEDGERHRRMIREGAYDACEFSICNYLVLRSEGRPFTGIPAFPNRKFRQSYIFVNKQAGIREPRDLEGKRVGLRGWAVTASLWVRGILQRYYEVDLTKVNWYAPGEALQANIPAEFNVKPLPSDGGVDGLLVSGELDAAIFPDVLPSVQRGAPEVGRLFEDYRAEEQAFYQRTRIFPISHLVAMKQEFAREHPTAPLSLLQAFRQSRDACFHRIEEQQILSLSWAGALLAEQRALMGEHYWPYNVTDNRHVLETVIDFAHEQGLIPQPFAVEELFVPESVAAPGS